MSIRDLEVRLTETEDRINARLGYREYAVRVDGVLLDPPPEVKHRAITSYRAETYMQFINTLGGSGNPLGFYEVYISRLIPEATVRAYKGWQVTRDTYTARCLPVSLEVQDSRYIVVLAVVK